MRKYLLAAAAIAALSTPAMARDGAPYVGIEGGILFDADTDFDLEVDDGTTVTDYDDAFQLDYKRGWDIDAIAGYDFGFIRAEGELGYKRVKVKEIEVSSALLNDLGEEAGQVVDVDDLDLDDRVTVLSGMINLLFDIGGDDGVSFYAGGGAGRARVKMFEEKDSAWAWQLIAGIRAPVSESVDIGLKYRFFNTGRLNFGSDFDAGAGSFSFDSDGRFRSHSLLASLVFNFGAPAAAVEMAPPPPPPPPATQTCPDGSVIPATSYCPPPPAPPAPPPPAPSGERG